MAHADPSYPQKPSHEEWLQWAQVVIERLTTCVHTYSHPPHDDVFMADKERQAKNARSLDLLKRLYALTDDAETPTDSLADVAHHDERMIAGLLVMMQETLNMLPELSDDMQKLLKSGWYDKFHNRIAAELFRGPMGRELEGIGSGHPENGRLPEVLQGLLEREVNGESRQPRKALHRHVDVTAAEKGPERHTGDDKRRWADKNAASLRSAGRVN